MKSAKAREVAPEPSFSVTDLVANGLTVLFARPRLAAGTAAFCVLFAYFTANAIHAQYREHPRALFSTREMAFDPKAVRSDPKVATKKKRGRETRIVIDRSPVKSKPQGDKTIASVQKALSQMGLYDGAVDGLAGPMTTEAILNYQKIVGLPRSGAVDAALLGELNQAPAIVSAIPTPRPDREDRVAQVPRAIEPASGAKPRGPVDVAAAPVPSEAGNADAGQAVPAVSAAPVSDDTNAGRIARIQAGLRAFGHDAIEIDGVAADATVDAIREFQRLFRLEPTGEADEAVEEKMREIGLIN